MAFEVKDKDLLARIGKLKTKSGTVETPLLFPVVNPAVQLIPPRKIREIGFEALITNAYILQKHFQNEPAEQGLHKFLGYDGVIMTDSGAYQILVYGDIEVSQKEIIAYQERINTDIATILDLPTGWKVSEKVAERTVKETLKRAKELFRVKTREDILWVGPVQGGKYLKFVSESAVEMGKLPFNIYALGSPTEVMERYRFDVLVDMIMTAKMNLPLDKPLHLFGAGHPMMFSLAVALGCDLFDSAAYALYARENRYMTDSGTWKLSELEYFPCTCPKCSTKTPKEVLEKPKKEREAFIAEHNLYVCLAELKRIKQAIRDGRLWEHLELRAHEHPSILQALKKFRLYEGFIEKQAPTVKKSGLFFYDSLGLSRPEVVRHRMRMAERYSKPEDAKVLLLLPMTQTKPFHKAEEVKERLKLVANNFRQGVDKINFCVYAAPFGVIPIELDEVYPLSQHETVFPPDKETREYVASQVGEYVKRMGYEAVLLFNDEENWDKTVLSACRKACRESNVRFKHFNAKKKRDKAVIVWLKEVLAR